MPEPVHFEEAPAFEIAEGKGAVTLLLGPPTGSARASLNRLSFLNGADVPPHTHAESDELLYVLDGRVKLNLGADWVEIDRGDAIVIPAGVLHAAHCATNAELLQVYVGAGPEERFRTLPSAVSPLVEYPVGDTVIDVPSLAPLEQALGGWFGHGGPAFLLSPHFGPTGKVDGVRLAGLSSQNPLAAVGLQKGDVLHAIAGVAIVTPEWTTPALAAMQSGKPVRIELTRRGQRMHIDLRVVP